MAESPHSEQLFWFLAACVSGLSLDPHLMFSNLLQLHAFTFDSSAPAPPTGGPGAFFNFFNEREPEPSKRRKDDCMRNKV